MLLIDGVRYLETPPKDEDELEQTVIEHAKDIFGENSIYLDKKYKLKSPAGIGSIPDGFAITFGVQNQWHIVEVELSSHDPYSHVTPQLDKFLSGIESGKTTDGIITALYSAINENEYDKIKLRKVLGNNEIHDFISHLIKDNPPVITVIIENNTPILYEALKKYTPKKIVEFRTFQRENAGSLVHAHLFEPIYSFIPFPQDPTPKGVSAPTTIGTFSKPTSADGFEISIANPSYRKFHLFYIPKEKRYVLPGYKVSFVLDTDKGQINTHVSSAPKGTQVGDLEAGYYIQSKLSQWYKAHPELKIGDKVKISVIEPMKRYRLEIEKL
jgi:hypothetical protein